MSISETPDKHSEITLLSLTAKVNDTLILIENQEKNTGIQKNKYADQKGKVNERIHQSHRTLGLTPAEDLDLFHRGQVTPSPVST